MAAGTEKDRAVAIARREGIVRARDFRSAGISPTVISRLEKEGFLARLGRGLYRLADAELSAAHSLAAATRAVPRGIIALLSALQFHGLTTQAPHQVWMLLPSNAWSPRNPPVTIRAVRASGRALTCGVERHDIEGVLVTITAPAKTVADCFKYRSKVGLDVATEALRDYLRRPGAKRDELWKYAQHCRVQNVIRPYLEAMQ
jgi:predicted transcriptional regulator of viral defense system